MQIRLDGQVAVVTGGSSGVGLATATALADAGAKVLVASRTPPPASAAVTHIAADLRAPGGPGGFVAAVLEEVDRVDVLVNNVGGGEQRLGGFLDVDDDQWQDTLSLNLMAMVRVTRALLPGMVERGSGSIVNVSTTSASEPRPGRVDYGAAKAAMVNLSKCLSIEFAPAGVRVNTVTLGPVDTPAWSGPGGHAEQLAAVTGKDVATLEREIIDGRPLPLGRFGQASEVAAVMLFLASSASSLVTGANWVVDGGYTHHLG